MTQLRTAAAMIAVALLPLVAQGQERIVALRAARVIDATGRPPIADGVVVVRGNHIEAVGPRSSVAIPAGAEWIKMTHGDLSPTTAQIPPALLKAGVDEAHEYGLKVTVHAVG